MQTHVQYDVATSCTLDAQMGSFFQPGVQKANLSA